MVKSQVPCMYIVRGGFTIYCILLEDERMLSVQKNEKRTRTVPFIESNSPKFHLNLFFLRSILKFVQRGMARGWAGVVLHSEK